MWVGNVVALSPFMFRQKPYTVEWLPITPVLRIRALVFKIQATTKAPRPLHLDIHGGAFLGGIPEQDALFCDLIARTTGAVVVSTTHRYAPEHVFPAAIDDIDAMVSYLHNHAMDRFGADPRLMTVSGFSAGGNLAYASTQAKACHEPAETAYKAIVTNCAVMDLRLSPAEKPKPPGFPSIDPLSFLIPLFDAYAKPAREKHRDDPRLSPIFADSRTLPKDIMMIIPGLDILRHEQLSFIKRLEANQEKRVQYKVFEDQIHGWSELPESLVGPTKMEAYRMCVAFLKNVYEMHGWTWT